MKLDEKFPLPKRESFNTPVKDYYPSQEFPLLFSTRVGHFPCQVCGKLTTWVVLHDNCRNHVCSEECMAKVLEIPESDSKPTAFSEQMREMDEALAEANLALDKALGNDKPTALIVEDDHSVAETLRNALEKVPGIVSVEVMDPPKDGPAVDATTLPVKDAGTSVCKYCGNPIPKSGKRGRPPTICDGCKARIANGEILTEKEAE